jgi:hypothetical protein
MPSPLQTVFLAVMALAFIILGEMSFKINSWWGLWEKISKEVFATRWPHPLVLIPVCVGVAVAMAGMAQNAHTIFLVHLGFSITYLFLFLAFLWWLNSWKTSDGAKSSPNTAKLRSAAISVIFLLSIAVTGLYHADKVQSLKPTTQILAAPSLNIPSGDKLPSALLYTPRLDLSPLIVGQTPILTPYCENAGSSTAFDAGQISNITPVEVDDPSKPGYISPAKTDWVYKSWPHQDEIGTSTIPKGPCTHMWLAGEKLTQQLKKELDTGIKVLVWVGLSRWRDEHGIFTYEQCYWRSQDGHWNICQNHNGVIQTSADVAPTSDDIRTRVHTWVSGTSMSIEDVSSGFPNAIFVDHIQLPSDGASMLLWQPKQYSQYLVLEARIGITDEPQKRAFEKLSVKQRTDFLREIIIEVNRLQLECGVQPTTNEMVTIRKTMLISTLTDDSFHNNIQIVNSAIALVEALVQKGLS